MAAFVSPRLVSRSSLSLFFVGGFVECVGGDVAGDGFHPSFGSAFGVWCPAGLVPDKPLFPGCDVPQLVLVYMYESAGVAELCAWLVWQRVEQLNSLGWV